jgi:isoleucyl-tRNA synthetase
MSTKFETYKGLNLPKIGEDILKFWEEEKVFEKSITSRDGENSLCFF